MDVLQAIGVGIIVGAIVWLLTWAGRQHTRNRQAFQAWTVEKYLDLMASEPSALELWNSTR